jgi:hypothetical protein
MALLAQIGFCDVTGHGSILSHSIAWAGKRTGSLLLVALLCSTMRTSSVILGQGCWFSMCNAGCDIMRHDWCKIAGSLLSYGGVLGNFEPLPQLPSYFVAEKIKAFAVWHDVGHQSSIEEDISLAHSSPMFTPSWSGCARADKVSLIVCTELN